MEKTLRKLKCRKVIWRRPKRNMLQSIWGHAKSRATKCDDYPFHILGTSLFMMLLRAFYFSNFYVPFVLDSWYYCSLLPHCAENKIGEGGYAEVYKGVIPDGRLIAVKRLSKGDTEELAADFLSELGIIVHVNHPNIAKVIGYGVEGGMHLVLDLSPNGSLESVLRGVYYWRAFLNNDPSFFTCLMITMRLFSLCF